MRKLLTIGITFVLVFSLVGCTPKPQNCNQIEYQGKIIEMMMTKEEVDSLLGEGTLIDSGKDSSYDIYYSIFEYSELELIFSQDNEGDTLYLTNMTWTTPDVNTYSGIRVGSSLKSLEKKFENTSNYLNGGAFYRVYYSNNELLDKKDYPLEEYPNLDCWQYYRYDGQDKETGIVTEISITDIKNSYAMGMWNREDS